MYSPEVPVSTMPVSTLPSSRSSPLAMANRLISVKCPDDWSQTEYDSPTAYSQWCRNFRQMGYPYPEKPDPVTTTPAASSPHQDLKLETTEPYRFATPVRALMEMPSQPFDSQFDCNEFQTPTQNRSSGRKRPRIGPTTAQKQFNDDVTNGLLVPDSQDESWEQYYNEVHTLICACYILLMLFFISRPILRRRILLNDNGSDYTMLPRSKSQSLFMY